jgi:ZIP family zinc transporter
MLQAFVITTLAGLATVLGALLALVVKKPGVRTMSLSMGFAAGVMIFVSFGGFLYHSQLEIGQGLAYVFFFAGVAAMFLLDVLIPHEYLAEKHASEGQHRMFKAGMLAALGIGVHNLPEGMAVFTGMLHGAEKLGWAVAVAIALHNIPEGLAMAAPIYASTGSRGKALGWSFLAGVAEPVGAVLAALILYPILSPTVMAATLAIVAGIMVFIALDELLPAASEEGAGHLGIVGVMVGMAVMALGLWMLHAVEPHQHGPNCSHGRAESHAPMKAGGGHEGHDHGGHEGHDH